MNGPKIQAAVKSHAARNHELKKLIEEKGVDLSRARSIDLHFWASGEEAACNLVDALKAEGYSPISKDPDVDDPSVWNVETQVEASPHSVTDPLFVEKLVRLALMSESEFDGWGTSI